jgi:3-oxoacyl-[acyl-carrier protein] reductase
MTELLDAFDLTGRVAVVTGAASGIGRASARMLAAAGAAVVCADVADGVKETAAAIVDAGGVADVVPTDVSARAEVDALVAHAVDEHGRLDVMCNIAGIMHMSPVLDTADDDFERVMGVNFWGVLFGCQAAGRVMVHQGRGSIINMASGAVDAAAPGLVCYSVAKAGVVQLTKNMATEVGPQGVRVNAIAPGLIITGMTGRAFTNPDGTIDDERRTQAIAGWARMSPMGLVGEPDDIAYAVLYLASDAARFVTGQILRPNGGSTMPW